jgi:zinc transporter ZupT
MFRILAVIAFIVAIILFVVVAIGSPSDAGTIQEWGFVSVAAGLLCLALEGVVPSITRQP